MARGGSTSSRTLNRLVAAFIAAVGRLDKSLSPQDTINRLRKHKFTLADSIYVFHILLASVWLILIGFPLNIAIPVLYSTALLIPFTSQFFLPATPVLAWVLTYFCSRFIPVAHRPSISVSLLPTLESVLYGANISDILTRYTHPVLDIIAWLPYGVLHFTLPFVVAAFLWLFRPKEALHVWASAFGYLNLFSVIVQIVLPCAPPWYELIYGLTPATYDVHGSAGGLARIDSLFRSKGYQTAFASSPVVFGAFPSLHSANATIEALFWSHFFPWTRNYAWAYAGVMYWATMYLTHHYLIDVVGGSCLATAFFYLWIPKELCGANATAKPGSIGGKSRSKHELYDLEVPRPRRGVSIAADTDLSSETSSPRNSEDEQDITYRSPNPNGNANFPPASPLSAAPLMGTSHSAPSVKSGKVTAANVKKSHRHTASIASLIRAEDRVEDGWSPIAGREFVFPPTPTSAAGRAELGMGGDGTGERRRGAV